MKHSQVARAEVRRIRPFPGQPREEFDEEGLSELAASIKEEGLHEPLLVRRVIDDPDAEYELIDGERRWRALVRLCVTWADVVVLNVGAGDEQYILAVIKNFARRSLTPIEKARAVRRVWNMPQYSKLENAERERRVAAVFGRSPTWVQNQMGLTNLAPGVQSLLDGKSGLSANAARELAPIKDPERQTQVAQRLTQSGMGAHGISRAAREAAAPDRKPVKPAPGRTARAEEQILFSLVARVKEYADQILDLEPARIAQALVAREDERVRLLAKVDGAILILTRVKSALQKLAGQRAS